MSDLFTSLRPASAWSGIAEAGRFGNGHPPPGTRLELLGHRAMATIVARPGCEAAVSRRVEKCPGLTLPATGLAIFGVEVDLIWSAPGQWLAVAHPGGDPGDLRSSLSGLAAVTDQSGSRGLVRVSGDRARAALAKGFAIDLDPTVFRKGSAAATSVAHINLQLWQDDELPSYVIAVPRSFSESFWSWLTSACAEFGCDVDAAA